MPLLLLLLLLLYRWPCLLRPRLLLSPRLLQWHKILLLMMMMRMSVESPGCWRLWLLT